MSTSGRRHTARGALLVALAGVFALILSTAAMAAGSFTVYANHMPDNTAIPGGPWSSGYNIGNPGSGDIGVQVIEGWGSGASASSTLSAPSGTTFASATLTANEKQYNGWNTGQAQIYTSWVNYGYLINPPTGYGGYYETGDVVNTRTVSNTGSVSMTAQCMNGNTCNGTNALFQIKQATYVINDPTNPNASLTSGGGELLDGSWHTGSTAELDVTASDAQSGAYRAFFRESGTTIYAALDPSDTRCTDALTTNGNAYEFKAGVSTLVPCKTASQTYTPVFNLIALGDGTHTGVVGVEDAAGNETVIGGTRTIKVNAPGGSLNDPGTTGPGGCVYQNDGTCSAPPSNTTPPSLDGSPVRAHALTADSGVWTNVTGATYSYQWQRCTSSDPTTCSNIVDANTATYTPLLADVGKRLRVVVTATTPSSGSASAASPVSAAVTDSAPAGTTPESGGGNPVAPGGGGGGGGGGSAPKDEPTTPVGTIGTDVGNALNPKGRGAPNGDCDCEPAMLDSVDLKAVFGDTKTNTLSTTFGESTVTISGRLTTKAGDAVRNAHIKVTAKLSGGGQFDDHNVVTDNDGKFTVPLPRTALAQTVRVAYLSHANDTDAADSESLSLHMDATASLTVTAGGKKTGSTARRHDGTVVRDGSWLTFRVAVNGPIPVGGKTVQIQSTCTGSPVCKRIWGDIGPGGKTNSKGVYVWRVKASGNRGTVRYRFRVVVPKVDGASNDWPFDTGYSPVASLTIKGKR
jgi:hypothetical protein